MTVHQIKPVPPKKRKQVKVGALVYAQLVVHMLEGIYTCEELAEMTGLHLVTVYHYTRELHAAGAAHITRWEKDARGRGIIKIYKIGQAKDAKREPLTHAQRQARLRSKRAHIAMMQRMAA